MTHGPDRGSQRTYDPKIDIVVPVYRRLDETTRCMDSLLRHQQRHAFEIIVIEDASPEAALVEYLQGLADRGSITLLHNRENLGFVRTANRGMRQHRRRDVVLLNSDTEVNGDWLDRLADCAHADPRIGAVTPFSNNGTICSYPQICHANDLPRGLTLSELDGLFQRANGGRWIEIPTAVGFCMYICRDCLEDVGSLDERHFGAGYGEETDFCMRARSRGWRSVLCADTFIYHVGGSSFGDRGQGLKTRATEAMETLHPEYCETVEAFIRQDPAAPLRSAVDRLRARRSTEQALQVLADRDRGTRELREQYIKTWEARASDLEILERERDKFVELDRAMGEAQKFVAIRERELVELQESLSAHDREVRRLTGENAQLREYTNYLTDSVSWRCTAPLRLFRSLLPGPRNHHE